MPYGLGASGTGKGRYILSILYAEAYFLLCTLASDICHSALEGWREWNERTDVYHERMICRLSIHNLSARV